MFHVFVTVSRYSICDSVHPTLSYISQPDEIGIIGIRGFSMCKQKIPAAKCYLGIACNYVTY